MRNLSILVVDDDVDIAKNLASILGDFGYETDVAHEGDSALKLVDERQYDVVLLDFVLPGMDGAAVYQNINDRKNNPVVIVLTGQSSEDVRIAVGEGVGEIFEKPIDMDELLHQLESVVRRTLVLVFKDPVYRESVRKTLEESEFRVGMVDSESQALNKLIFNQCNVVLLCSSDNDSDDETLSSAFQQINPRPTILSVREPMPSLLQTVDQLMTGSPQRSSP